MSDAARRALPGKVNESASEHHVEGVRDREPEPVAAAVAFNSTADDTGVGD